MQGTPTRLEGAPNFREVGENTPGLLELKPRSLLRSSHLGFLKNKDTDTLKDLKISLLCDLRLDEERRSHPNRVDPQTAARTKNFCIMPGSAEGFKQQIMRGELTPERAHKVSSASLRPIYSVDERYLKHALTRARSLTGSLEAYLEKSLAVDIPLRLALQERFLRTR